MKTKGHVTTDERANDIASLLTKKRLAQKVAMSTRTIDNLQKRGVIPFIRISPRMVRFSLQRVLAALDRFEVKEVH